MFRFQAFHVLICNILYSYHISLQRQQFPRSMTPWLYDIFSFSNYANHNMQIFITKKVRAAFPLPNSGPFHFQLTHKTNLRKIIIHIHLTRMNKTVYNLKTNNLETLKNITYVMKSITCNRSESSARDWFRSTIPFLFCSLNLAMPRQ